MDPITLGVVIFLNLLVLEIGSLLLFAISVSKMLELLRRKSHHTHSRLDVPHGFWDRDAAQNKRLRAYLASEDIDRLGDAEISNLGRRARTAHRIALASLALLIVVGFYTVRLWNAVQQLPS